MIHTSLELSCPMRSASLRGCLASERLGPSRFSLSHRQFYNGRVCPSSSGRRGVRRLKVTSLVTPCQAAGAIALGGLVAWGISRVVGSMPNPALLFNKDEFNNAVVSRCPTILSEYKNFWPLWNGHVETIWAAWFRRDPGVKYSREILKREDGGSVAIDSFDPGEMPALPDDAPVVILMPGLAGGSGCVYVQYSALRAYQYGIRAVVFNSRGTADSPVTSPQFYSASFTGDTRATVDHIASKYPKSKLLAVGWSLGGNILVNYLGEEGDKTPLVAAASLCNPFDLCECDKALQSGFSRLYDRNLGQGMQKLFVPHAHLFEGKEGFDVDLAQRCNTVREFDAAVTHVSFGWKDVDAYYKGSGSRLAIPKVRIPLLCIQALDDPIAVEAAIPFDAIRNNPKCTLVTTSTGGHLGWVAGDGGLFGAPWSDLASFEWLDAVLKEIDVLEKKLEPMLAGKP